MQRLKDFWASGRTGKIVITAGGGLALAWICCLVALIASPASPEDEAPTAIGEALQETETVQEPTNTPEPSSTPTPTPAPLLTATAVSQVGEIATVTRVVDGDTIEVEMNGLVHDVRYIGVNTPESDQTCGSEATAANVALVEGQTVMMVKDVSEVDQYGRLLRYVYVGDTFVNAELVAQGFAEAVQYPPDVAHADDFANLEMLAEANDLGCHPTGVFEAIAAGAASAPEAATSAPASTVAAPTQAPVPTQPQPVEPTSAPPPTELPAPTSAPAAVCDCSGNVYNCENFNTQGGAQACFGYCWTVRGYDVHRLDGDNDGIACEALP